jgi:hypothetical protein
MSLTFGLRQFRQRKFNSNYMSEIILDKLSHPWISCALLFSTPVTHYVLLKSMPKLLAITLTCSFCYFVVHHLKAEHSGYQMLMVPASNPRHAFGS